MTQKVPLVPTSMPTPRKGRYRGVEQADFQVALKFVTPVLGGGVKAGFLDTVDLVRVPSVRGHLRFWWRALQPPAVDRQVMLEAERSLWGGMNSNDDSGAASKVFVRISTADHAVHRGGEPYQQRKFPTHSYASFSARDDNKTPPDRRDDNPSRKFTQADGLAFTLHVCCPKERLNDVENAVRAWILFGGYGSRTRRGMGSLTVTADRERWLPAVVTRDALANLFGHDSLRMAALREKDTARLSGAGLVIGKTSQTSAAEAWLDALRRLVSFRQGDGIGRDPAPAQDKNRPSRSRWPEADCIRILADTWPEVHSPIFKGPPTWPRAQFGLPIGGEFVRFARITKNPYSPPEPGKFEIKWEPAEALRLELPPADAKRLGERLASPLIVKAIPLSTGQFVAAALWLHRGFPAGEVVGGLKDGGPKGRSSFEAIHASGDPVPHPHRELEGRKSIRDAFMAWLVKCGWMEVAP